MNVITYQLNGKVQSFDAETLQEANQKIRDIENRFNVPGNEFRWTHPIEQQLEGLKSAGVLLQE